MLKKIGQQLCPRKTLLFLAPNVSVHCKNTMGRTLYILIAIFIISCSNQQTGQNDTMTADTINIIKDTLRTNDTELQPDKQIVTEEFLDLVRYLDISGFICDSARFAKTYSDIYQGRQIRIDNYLFYKLEVSETYPISEHMNHVKQRDDMEKERKLTDTKQQRWWKEWKEKWEVDTELLDKAENIIAYFYVEKSLFDGTGRGTYYDGIIEEWKFPDAQSAQDAADELSNKETMVYVNRGAYICYFDKYMYVFHSRSAGFYTPLKKFWLHFSEVNKATIPNKYKQRRNY